MKLPSRPLTLILLLGLLLRITTMLWSFNFRENPDILVYRDWATISYVHSFADVYKPDYLTYGTLPSNYPPGIVYIFAPMYQGQLLISKIILRITHQPPGSIQWINHQLIDTALRLPSIIAELLIGLMIYLLVKAHAGKRIALFASSLFLFNPAVIYNSSFWGQTDSINNLLFFIAIYYFLNKNFYLSLLGLFLCFFIKLSLIFILPFFLLIIYICIKDKKKFLKALSLSIFMILLLTLPISLTPHLWLKDLLLNQGQGVLENITVFAFNFWWFILKPTILSGPPINLFSFSQITLVGSPLSSEPFIGITLNIWSFLFFAIFSFPLVYKILRGKLPLLQNPKVIFLFFTLLSLLGFLFLPRMHERYLYPVFPLLATYVGLKRKYLWLYVTLSLSHLINLYFVWHPMPIPLLTHQVMNNSLLPWIFSIVIVIGSAILYFQSLRPLFSHEIRP